MNDQWNQGDHHQGEQSGGHEQGYHQGHQEGQHQQHHGEQVPEHHVQGDGQPQQEEQVQYTENDAEEAEGDTNIYDVSPSGGSSTGKYSDNDLRYIFRFVHKLSLAPFSERESFLDALGLGKADIAQVIPALYPAEGRTSNLFNLYNLAKDLDPAGDPIAYGQSIVRLMGTLGEMDTDELRTLSKSIDAISEQYSPEADLIRYTRRQTSQDVAQKVIAIIPSWDQDARQFLDWATDLLMIWPRKES